MLGVSPAAASNAMMGDANFWPTEHLLALGRPLTAWDICPECERPAREHVWAGGRLVCKVERPADKVAARAAVEAERARETQIWREQMKQEMAAREAAQMANRAERVAMNRQLRERGTARKDRETTVATSGRQYFDE